MIKSTLRFGMVFLALLGLNFTIQAQNEIYTEDFSNGGLPAGWTTMDESGNGGLWTWCDDPVDAVGAGCVVNWGLYVNQHGDFASTTADNGFLVADSDDLGALASPHIIQVTTAAYDCSALTEVWVKTENLIGVYEYTTTNNAVLRVSTDGVNWTAFNMFDIAPGSGGNEPGSIRWTNNPGIALTDISSVAAGESTVYLQWSWTGNYEYYWLLDDLIVYDSDPTIFYVAAHDMRVNSTFAAVAPNFYWPLDMVESFGFLADVENAGFMDQTNVNLNVTIEDEIGNTVYTENLDYGTIGADSLAENVPFASAGFTPTAMGAYFGTYTVSADSIDLNPDNNTVEFAFAVTDTLFSKDDGVDYSTRPADSNWDVDEAWSWAYGNYYYVPVAPENAFFSYVSFTLDVSDNPDLAGENVTVRLYEWTDNNADENADPDERTEIATMIYTLDGNEVGDSYIYLPVTTLLGDPVPLSDDTEYAVMVEFQTDIVGKTVLMGVSELVDYSAMIFRSQLDGNPRYGSLLGINGALETEPFSSLGFGRDLVPTVSLSYTIINNVKEPLPLNGNLTVFPNPSNKEVTLDMDFNETMQDVTIQLFDLTGKLMETRTMENVKQQQASFNVSTLANGNYIFKVTTEQGTRSERFTVQR
ncbi:MAG: T9SS type A sorting domain-containing protein [Saprospirales bacterium]|nr:T9SS type A sorting domain-containing protein [Saprospirales bacterium]